jgi:hypothetical protein
MSEAPKPGTKPEAAPVPRRSRFAKWAQRLSIAIAVLFLLGIVGLFSARIYIRHTGKRALDEEVARVDAEDPGWRFDDLMAARERAAPPETENSAVVVRKVRSLIPNEWKEWLKSQPVVGAKEAPPALNRRQSLGVLTRDTDLADATRAARNLGLTLRNYPRGYHAVVVTDMPFIESLDETQGAREVAHLMKVDALLAAEEGDAVQGLRAAHAILNTGRSVGDEPALISSLVRYACGAVAVEAAMRVLALTEPKDALPELAALQEALFAEVEEPVLLNGLRGERAVMNRFYDGANNGTISADAIAKMGDVRASAESRTVFYFRRAFLPEDQRRFLRTMSELIEVGKGPPQDRIARTEQIEADLRANRDIRYLWHALFTPAAVKVMEASVRNRAELLAAATLIACERFRLTRGRWPTSLAEIPKDILPTVPTDPFTGAPIRFAKLPDGIAVYSAAPKTIRSLEQPRLTNPLGGSEVGWRLYDPQLRRLPPLPTPKPDNPDEAP